MLLLPGEKQVAMTVWFIPTEGPEEKFICLRRQPPEPVLSVQKEHGYNHRPLLSLSSMI